MCPDNSTEPIWKQETTGQKTEPSRFMKGIKWKKTSSDMRLLHNWKIPYNPLVNRCLWPYHQFLKNCITPWETGILLIGSNSELSPIISVYNESSAHLISGNSCHTISMDNVSLEFNTERVWALTEDFNQIQREIQYRSWFIAVY